MGFLNKLFGGEYADDKPPLKNDRLVQLLQTHRANKTSENRQHVMRELQRGFARLILPAVDAETGKKPSRDEEIELTSLTDIDGVITLFVFTKEEALWAWARQWTHYTVMRTSALLDYAMNLGVECIVIDHKEPTKFVIQRHIEATNDNPVEFSSVITHSTHPIEEPLLTNLKKKFVRMPEVLEVYQFSLTKDGYTQTELQLAFKLEENDADTRVDCLHVVQDTMREMREEFRYQYPINLIYIDDEDQYRAIKEVQDSLIFKR